MTVLILFLVAGFVIGNRQWLPHRWQGLPAKLTLLGLFALLFLMGIQIGSSEVVDEIWVYGGRALLLAAGAIAGSTGAVWAAVRVTGLGGWDGDDS